MEGATWHRRLSRACSLLEYAASTLTIQPATANHSETLIKRLEAEGATWTHGEWTDYALRLKHPDHFNSPSFAEGLWLAQDEAFLPANCSRHSRTIRIWSERCAWRQDELDGT